MGRKRGVQYRPGSFWRQDDRSGFSVRAEDMRQEWNELLVDKKLYEPRQPQDFVQGVADDQTVDQARPIPPAVFVGPISTELALPAVVGATFLYLDAINGFNAGRKLGVMMDSGEYFNTTIDGPPTSFGVNIAAAMPGTAARGNIVTVFIPAPGVFP